MEISALLHDARLCRLTAETLSRIPAVYTETVLKILAHPSGIILISDYPKLGFQDVFAYTRTLRDEFEGMQFIWLNSRRLANMPDEVVRFGIAHEFAHIVCDHHGADADGEPSETQENQADAVVMRWGFRG